MHSVLGMRSAWCTKSDLCRHFGWHLYRGHTSKSFNLLHIPPYTPNNRPLHPTINTTTSNPSISPTLPNPLVSHQPHLKPHVTSPSSLPPPKQNSTPKPASSYPTTSSRPLHSLTHANPTNPTTDPIQEVFAGESVKSIKSY